MAMTAAEHTAMIDQIHDDIERMAVDDGGEAIEMCRRWRREDHLTNIMRRNYFLPSRLIKLDR